MEIDPHFIDFTRISSPKACGGTAQQHKQENEGCLHDNDEVLVSLKEFQNQSITEGIVSQKKQAQDNK